MSLLTNTNQAIEILELFRESLKAKGDYEHDIELADMVQMLDSPLFKQIITVQDSLKELKEKSLVTPNIHVDDFEFSPTGELLFQQGGTGHDHMVGGSQQSLVSSGDGHSHHLSDYASGGQWRNTQEDLSAGYVDVQSSGAAIDQGLYDSAYIDNEDFIRNVQMAGQGRDLETIKLMKPDFGGLGFSVVGLKSENRGELGIFVQDIQAGGVADRDGRLHESDQILAINGKRVDTVMKHEDAISLLQNTKGVVELIVAAGGINQTPRRGMDGAGSEQSSVISRESDPPSLPETIGPSGTDQWRQSETIELHNDGSGLGFGIVGGKNSGVIVRSIVPGGVADRDGRLKSGDHILQINNEDLSGMGSDQVANIIRRAGDDVKLVIDRILPGESLDMDQQGPIEQGAGYEVETFEVQLQKNEKGLGITITGYVGNKETSDNISAIFIQKIAEGSAAAQDGKLRVNDQIIEVDGQSLNGLNNQEAVRVLKNTGPVVTLVVARILERREEGLTEDDLEMAVNNSDHYRQVITPDEEDDIVARYVEILGPNVDIFVAQFSKFQPDGSLGISVEGSACRDDSLFMAHRIHSVYQDGPVGQTGVIQPGDFLAEINGLYILDLTHPEVVRLIQSLPQHIRLVTVRNKPGFEVLHLPPPSAPESPEEERRVIDDADTSLPEDVNFVELVKSDKGLGFSILDYQDPEVPGRSVIVIKSLVAGGVAELSGGISSGDQLVSVNNTNLENATLDLAVQTLKSAPQGVIVLGVRAPDPHIAAAATDVPLNNSFASLTNKEMNSSPMLASLTSYVEPEEDHIDKAEFDEAQTTDQEHSDSPSSIEKDDHSPEEAIENSSSISHKAVVPVASVFDGSGHVGNEGSEITELPEASIAVIEKEDLSKKSEYDFESSSLERLKPSFSVDSEGVRTVHIKKDVVGLGISLGNDPDGKGCPVIGILESGTIKRDGHVQSRDRIVSIDGESLRGGTIQEARALLRRAALQEEVVISYLPSTVIEAKELEEKQRKLEEKQRELEEQQRKFEEQQKLHEEQIRKEEEERRREREAAEAQRLLLLETSRQHSISSQKSFDGSQKSFDGSQKSFSLPDLNDIEGEPETSFYPEVAGSETPPPIDLPPPRTVDIHKHPEWGLGISIVGGRADEADKKLHGIFIKHVLDVSPAGQSGLLKTGDQILEVGGVDLSNATHEQAVAAIRTAASPVRFVVRSLPLRAPLTPGEKRAAVKEETENGLMKLQPTKSSTSLSKGCQVNILELHVVVLIR